jgi:hypothetical protein
MSGIDSLLPVKLSVHCCQTGLIYYFFGTTHLEPLALSITGHSMLHSILHYPLPFLLVGFLLLLFGRRLFWLFVAVAGFVAGIEAAPYILPHQTELFTLAVALVLGLLGALLALFLQKLAIAIGGFVAGGYLAAVLGAPLLGGAGIRYPGTWLCFVVGGILGAILLYIFFNWALIILSSMQGAHLILQGVSAPRHYFSILLVVLALIGIFIQAATYRRPSKTPA